MPCDAVSCDVMDIMVARLTVQGPSILLLVAAFCEARIRIGRPSSG